MLPSLLLLQVDIYWRLVAKLFHIWLIPRENGQVMQIMTIRVDLHLRKAQPINVRKQGAHRTGEGIKIDA